MDTIPKTSCWWWLQVLTFKHLSFDFWYSKKGFLTFVWLLFLGNCLYTAEARANELKAIGVSVADFGNPFFVKIAKSVSSRAQQLAGRAVRIYVRSSAYDLPRQVSQIDEFIRLKVDLIILAAADSVKIDKAILKAQQAGIKVIAVDINAKGADITITTDNVQAGEIACDYMAKKIGYEGNVVIINGASISSVIDRVKGCKAVLGNYPKISILSDRLNGGGSIEGGMEKMTFLLNSFQSIDGVFCINDPTAFGALTAARQAGRSEFFITSVDGAPAAETSFQGKSTIWVASAAQFPNKMATMAVELGIKLLKGAKIESHKILIPAELITAENIGQYEGWGR